MLSEQSPHNGDFAAAATADPQETAEAIQARLAFERSRTFVARMPDPAVRRLRIVVVSFILIFGFVVIPLLSAGNLVPTYSVNRLGKFLCFAIAALGIDLIWGYTGLLSLCQAMFFCLGGYVMAMHLSLPEGWGDVRAMDNFIPQFMSFNSLTQLPGFWQPFRSFPLTLAMCVLLPGALASVLGFFILRSRVRGVYFAIVTQALAWGAWLLISRNEMLLGGTNGLTNFYKPFTTTKHWIIGLYLLTLTMVVIAYLICRAIVRSRLGRVLIAVRDRETRLYFAGYKPYAFKVFAFAVGAMLAGVGGMLYPAQVAIITPQDMNVEASMFMVVWVAAGGRGKLWGAIFGAILLNVLKSSLSSDLPSMWLFVEGGIFVAVVLFFPEGFVGIWTKLEEQISMRAPFSRIAVTASPFVIVCLFIIVEALGLEPSLLQRKIDIIFIPNAVQWKYILLIVLLSSVAVAYLAQKKQDRLLRAVPGFTPKPVPASGGRVPS
jgi:urea transport system permease protein